MKVIHVNKNLVDIFWGNGGWEPHTRLRINRNADKTTSLGHVSGSRLPFKVRSQVIRHLGL